MKHEDLASKLRAAMTSRGLVRVTRRIEPGVVDGYIVGMGEYWVLLLIIGEGVTYAGFQAFRLRDVNSIAIPSPHASFYQAVLRKRRLRRPSVPRLNLSSTHELICSAGKCFPLVTIHREKADPDVCHIGRVISASPTSVSLLEITPDAAWEQSPRTYRLAQVTRVDFGGPYEEALALIAVPPRLTFAQQ